MKLFFTISFLLISMSLSAQDSVSVLPKRYIKWGALHAPFGIARLDAEWKKDPSRSNNLAANAYINADWFQGLILEGAKRYYLFQKKRLFWHYHVGMGYIQREMQLTLTESTIYPGVPTVIYETKEIVYNKHKWLTAGAGIGIGYQQLIGKKKRWLADAGLGVQYYIHHYKKEKEEEYTTPDGVVHRKSWEHERYNQSLGDKGRTGPFGNPFSYFFINLAVGHNF